MKNRFKNYSLNSAILIGLICLFAIFPYLLYLCNSTLDEYQRITDFGIRIVNANLEKKLITPRFADLSKEAFLERQECMRKFAELSYVFTFLAGLFLISIGRHKNEIEILKKRPEIKSHHSEPDVTESS